MVTIRICNPGCTNTPRVTSPGAIHNALALDKGVASPHRADSRGFIDHWASWVPLYHDMGLISNLTLMLKGVDLHLMPSEAFLGRPRLWLELLASGQLHLGQGSGRSGHGHPPSSLRSAARLAE